MAVQKNAEPAQATQTSKIDEKLRRLPGGAKALASVHDATAKSILKLSERLVADARARLGPETSKPRIAEVKELFTEHVGDAPKVPDRLDQELRRPDRAAQVAPLDETWDKAFAGAINVFDQTSIESGGKVQEAIDNWRLAVRVYETEARSAGAIFKAEIEKAKLRQGSQGGSHPDVDALSDYYAAASETSSGLVKYEQSMADATGALATAMGALVKDLFDSSMSVSVGEAVLIDAEQKASESFWAGVQSELNNRS